MPTDLSLDGRVALVTGAGSGIGKASAFMLAEHGCKVGLLSRTAEEVEANAERIAGAGGEALPLTADIRHEEQMERAVRDLVDKWSRLDIVVANAGINGVWAPLEKLQPGEFRETMDINVTGTFLTIKYAAPYLKRQGGAVVVVSSINGTRVFTKSGATAYSSSKAAQVAMMKMLAIELADDRIRVNAVCPGAIETEIDENTEARDMEEVAPPVEYPEGKIPLTDGEPGLPREVARLVLFLSSDASALISGTEMWIDGAESLLQG
jgi:NAD(P)-dependent dehydrogenase (short-subunit alcohol dehydrogenase family)